MAMCLSVRSRLSMCLSHQVSTLLVRQENIVLKLYIIAGGRERLWCTLFDLRIATNNDCCDSITRR